MNEIETKWEAAKEQASVHHGKATVPWGFQSGFYRAGWVLPGGERTLNRDRVLRVAQAMDELMQ